MKAKLLWTMLMAFVLMWTLALAAQDRDDQNRDRDDQHRQMEQNRDYNSADRDDQWENRKGWEYRTYEGDRHPDGWMQGNRTDWRNCSDRDGDRQYNCYSYQYQGQPYYYYRDDNGRMIVRRHHRDHDRDDMNRDRDHDHDHDQH